MITKAEKQKQEAEQRQQETYKAATASGKTVGQVLSGIRKNVTNPTRKGYFTEGDMIKVLRAQYKPLAGRTDVINNTLFVFDKNGITRVLDQGNTRNDFNVLLGRHGCVELDEFEQPKPSDHMFYKKVEEEKPAEPVKEVIEQASNPEVMDPMEGEPDLVVPKETKTDAGKKPASKK